MPDDDLIEAGPVPEIFVDGFTRHISRNGVMTCVGYRLTPDSKTIVVKLVWPAVNTPAAIDDAHAAMDAEAPPTRGAGGAKRGVH